MSRSSWKCGRLCWFVEPVLGHRRAGGGGLSLETGPAGCCLRGRGSGDEVDKVETVGPLNLIPGMFRDANT